MKYIRRMIAALLVVGTIGGFSAQTAYALEEKRAMLGSVTSDLETVNVIKEESVLELEVNLNEIEKINRDREIYRIRAEYLRSNIDVTSSKLTMLEEKKPNIIQAALLTLTNGFLQLELTDILNAVHSSVDDFQVYQGDYLKVEDREAILLGLQEKLEKLEADLKTAEEFIAAGDRRYSDIEAINGTLSLKIGEVITEAETLSVQKSQLEEEIRTEEEKQRLAELERRKSTTFIRPASGRLTSRYGNRVHPVTRRYTFHDGIDIANSRGTGILASRNGKVTFAGYKGTYGNLIIVSHGNGIETAYAHLSSINVRVGQSVTQGDVIGKMGSTGRSTGNHLHFEIRIGGSTVNPSKYFN